MEWWECPIEICYLRDILLTDFVWDICQCWFKCMSRENLIENVSFLQAVGAVWQKTGAAVMFFFWNQRPWAKWPASLKSDVCSSCFRLKVPPVNILRAPAWKIDLAWKLLHLRQIICLKMFMLFWSYKLLKIITQLSNVGFHLMLLCLPLSKEKERGLLFLICILQSLQICCIF